MNLNQVLDQLNYPQLPLTGKIQRFDRAGELSGWFIGQLIKTPSGKEVAVASFGDWKTGEQHSFKDDAELSEVEAMELNSTLDQLYIQAEQEKRETQNKTAAQAFKIWNKRVMAPGSRLDYCKRKGISASVPTDPGSGAILVPSMDIDGKIWGLQRIYPDGNKMFMKGQKISGCFYLPDSADLDQDTYYICEGWATGYSIYRAVSPAPVFICFNAGNLKTVVSQLVQRYPNKEYVICADNDQFTTDAQGNPWNPGIDKATEALSVVVESGAVGVLVYPQFKTLETKPTDFNDLAVIEGEAAVAAQLRGDMQESCKESSFPVENVGSLQTSVGTNPTQKKKGKKATESKLVRLLLEDYKDTLVKDSGEIFEYVGTHWRQWDEDEVDQLKRRISVLSGGKFKIHEIESAFKHFLLEIPKAPIPMFIPRWNLANFQNGTLTCNRVDGKLELRFREHQRDDYLIHVIPMDYPDTEVKRSERNEEFDAAMERILKGDDDHDGKLRAIRQMYGACLMPLFPNFFLVHGPSGSGKSTVIQIAQHMIHEDNWCSVEPHEMKGFEMESMVGKLVNISTDIDVSKVMNDANVKKVVDRMPVRIDRKFRKAVTAPLPSVHIFGANAIPPSLDGASRAHSRRWSFIELNRFDSSKEDSGVWDYANWVWDRGPEGILNFALEGLRDLVDSNGKFFNPASGRETIEEWQMESDILGMFLRSIEERDGDSVSLLVLKQDGRVSRQDLWQHFSMWMEEFGHDPRLISRNKLYNMLRQKGFKECTTQGVRSFKGIEKQSGDGVNSLGPGSSIPEENPF